MAVKNRPTIGTVPCEHCDGTRSVHMYESGRHKGKLFTRCPSCTETKHKMMWKGSNAEQALLRSKATFKPGFESLAGEPVIESDPKPQKAQGVAPVEEPQNHKDDPKTTPKPEPRSGKGGLVIAGFVGIILIIAGVAA